MEIIPFSIQDDTEAARRKRRRCTLSVLRGADDKANEGRLECKME